MRKLPGYAAGREMGLEVDEQGRVLLQHAIAGTRNKAEAFLGEAAMKVGEGRPPSTASGLQWL